MESNMDFESIYQKSIKLRNDLQKEERKLEFNGENVYLGSSLDLFHSDLLINDKELGKNQEKTTQRCMNVKKDKANTLLSSIGFDAKGLTKQLDNIEFKTSYEPIEKIKKNDYNSYLEYQHQLIRANCIEQLKLKTKLDRETSMKDTLFDEWEIIKKKQLIQLSGKIKGQYDNSSILSCSSVLNDVSKEEIFISSSGKKRRPIKLSTDSLPIENDINIKEFNDLINNKVSNLTPEMNDFATIINKLNKYYKENKNENETNDANFNLINKFLKVTRKYYFQHQNAIQNENIDIYKCWKLLNKMINPLENSISQRNNKQSKRNEYGEGYESDSNIQKNKLAYGARSYLEVEFLDYIKNEYMVSMRKEDSNKENQENIFGEIMYNEVDERNCIKTYALNKLKKFNTLYNRAMNDNINEKESLFWAEIYYCMRSGKYNLALDILSDKTMDINNPVMNNIKISLEYRINLLNGLDSIVKTNFFEEDPESHRLLTHRFKKLRNLKNDITSKYERTIINILINVNPNNYEEYINDTVEDYLWFNLSFLPIISPYIVPNSQFYQSSFSNSSENGFYTLNDDQSEYTISTFSNKINKYGPSYFEGDNTGLTVKKSPFFYFRVLLLAQDFERALDYLVSRGKAIIALHFAIVLHYYGLLHVYNYNVHNNDEIEIIMEKRRGSLLITLNKRQKYGKIYFDMETLIRQYNRFIYNNNKSNNNIIHIAMDYIYTLYLPEFKSIRANLVSTLLIETHTFDYILGYKKLNDFSKNPSIIDHYVNNDDHEISEIIEITINKLKNKLNEKQASDNINDANNMNNKHMIYSELIDLYILINDYINGLELINNRLIYYFMPTFITDTIYIDTNILNIELYNKERKYWKLKANEKEQMIDLNNKNGIYNNNISLIYKKNYNLLILLLNLYKYFDIYEKKQYEDAILFMEKLDLVPSEHNISNCRENFIKMDVSIKKKFHHIIIVQMKCYYQLYFIYKNRHNVSKIQEDYDKLHLISHKAKTLVAFAGSIHMQLVNGVSKILQDLEMQML